MKRTSIRGWTWKIFGYRLEFVTINHILRIIAFYDKENIGQTKRLEWCYFDLTLNRRGTKK